MCEPAPMTGSEKTGRQICRAALHRLPCPAAPAWRIDLLGIDSVDHALALWTVSGDAEAAERILFRARQRIALVALKRNAARWG